ncbi:hypothetical protein LIER_37432 [Lithospermum erythrorhizon]|uniref:Uncharacterized protein n=1 Tax=Lithospermum erythrorhizon TaxID=34254 RepID=A0AAV3PMA7_LITER
MQLDGQERVRKGVDFVRMEQGGEDSLGIGFFRFGVEGRWSSWSEQVRLGFSIRLILIAPCEHVSIREGNRSDVPLTQPGNGPEGTDAWGMSTSRRKAHFELWVIGRATLSD